MRTTDQLDASITPPTHRFMYCTLGGECARYSACLDTHVIQSSTIAQMKSDFEEYTRSNGTCRVPPSRKKHALLGIDYNHIHSRQHSRTKTCVLD